MKVANRLGIVCIAALACLAASAAFGRQPAGSAGKEIKRNSQFAFEEPEQDSSSVPPEPIEEPDLRDSDGAMSPWTGADTTGGEQGEYCDTCGGDRGGSCGSRGCFGGLWYGSVDYLLFRPRFSQAVAAVNRVDTSDSSTSPATSTSTDTVVEYPFSYQSGFRVAAGYRLLDCGGDFQVAYWRMTNDAQYSNGPADISNNNPFIAGNLENNPGNGQFLNASTGVTANIFDVDFAKCISMGGPSCDSCGGCDACDACFCPRWDLRFFAGARIADISRFNNNVVVTGEGNGVSFGNINARFVGAGPRVGILGRRYFGQCGLWSVYAKASQGLLIGDYRMGRTQIGPLEDEPTITGITNQFDLFRRMVPVTDIEIGGTWQMAPFTFVSVGYFFQCWWDLGQGENIQGTNFGPLDSANILGFDGLFVRGEMLF
jgi:Legionella pneumophila major outer membrane protein precursor